jgi:putative acetyltransferase
MDTPAVVRKERYDDAEEIRHVNELAFETPAEATLVDLLRGRGKLLVSLVAERDGRLVGHIAFSSVRIEPEAPGLSGAGLGPMAVVPDLQKSGIGSLLVREGLDRCRRLGIDGVVVLGHPRYYPRFGFAPASRFGLRCEWTVPDEVFMAMELRPGALAGISGLARYEPEFEDV